jgi:CTP:molybdopterin cytidylyltransferase MocA
MTAAIILAAGASTRLGSPKQLVMYSGERLLERTIRTARDAGCSPLVVVLGANATRIQQECNLEGTVLLLNHLWPEGMGSSLRLGISSVQDADSAVVMACDMPALTSTHLRALISAGKLTASCYAERNGVPAFFPAAAFPALLASAGDAGARHMLQNASAIPLQHGELDIDTREDLQHLERLG